MFRIFQILAGNAIQAVIAQFTLEDPKSIEYALGIAYMADIVAILIVHGREGKITIPHLGRVVRVITIDDTAGPLLGYFWSLESQFGVLLEK